MEELNFKEIMKQVIRHRKEAEDAWYKENYTIQLNRISPSQIAKCLRRQYFDSAGMGKDAIDDGLLKIFYFGNIIHDEIAFPILNYYFNNIYDGEITVDNELPVIFKLPYEEEIFLKGKIDNVLNIDDTLAIPIEIKSIGAPLKYLDEPYMEHKAQLYCYMGMLGAPYGHIVYIHKQTLDAKEFTLKADDEIFYDLMKRAYEIYTYRKDGIIPLAEVMVEDNDYYNKKNTPCDRCPYLNFCLTNSKEEIK